MKRFIMHQSILFLALFSLAVERIHAAPDLQVRQPSLDNDGRFWVYRNGPTHPPMPFSPYGWMSDATNLAQIFQVDLECRDHPNTVWKASGLPERDRCIRIKVSWGDAAWASIAFISGSDKPPWWGDTNTGKYFNLGSLPKKKLVFYARGERGGEAIKAQIGVLGDKPYGDSLPKPIVSEELKLTQEWVRHEIDLKDVPNSDLAHICNGFSVFAERASQTGSGTETQFYIDDVYFE
jgi:hypothetical protein